MIMVKLMYSFQKSMHSLITSVCVCGQVLLYPDWSQTLYN